MRRALPLAVLSSLSLALPVRAAEPPAAVTAIRAGRLLDVAAEKVRENVVVVVEAGRIREIGTSVPAGADARRPLGPDAAARPDRRAHARAAAGRRHLGRVRRAAHGRVAAVPDAARHARDEDRARSRLHHAARHRQRGRGLRRRRPEARRRAWSHRRAAAVRRDEGAGADRRLSDPDGRLGALAPARRRDVRRPRRLPARGARPDLARRRLDQGLRRPLLLQDARRAASAASRTSPSRSSRRSSTRPTARG